MGKQKYVLQLNNGNENFGTTGKTITANEQCEVAGYKELAEEMSHFTKLTGYDENEYVIRNLMKAIVHLICQGKRVVLPIGSDNKAAAAFHLDLHLKGGSINEAKAAELGFNEITLDNLSDIVRAAGGLKVGVAIEVEQALLDAVKAKGVEIELADKVNIPRILRKENQGGDGNQGGNTGGNGGGNPDDGMLG
jgi:hypothetical protein